MSRFSDTNSENRYGYALNQLNNSAGGVRTGGGGGGGGDRGYDDSSHYYSGVYPPYSGGSSVGASGYKAYSTVNTEQLKSSQIPLTVIDPPHAPIINSYIIWSIFNLFCCGIICGIVTTAFSIKIISLYDKKAYKQAQRLSGKVMFANIVVTAFGALAFIIVFPYVYTAIYPYLPKINY